MQRTGISTFIDEEEAEIFTKLKHANHKFEVTTLNKSCVTSSTEKACKEFRTSDLSFGRFPAPPHQAHGRKIASSNRVPT
ncbi:hypothetical protein H5410_048301 [Solanum commersonii]|uniref:Uncharacterized protein n=1 Tax=Solanum commersonii TaxID=4109 RepID=A0A9J5XHS3_SOLCO|nr:hypothetical protein H5410_048301 [Solanum commersonii]